MAERTPGDWHIRAGYDWVIESQDGTSVAGIYTPKGVREVRQANSRFIAAAPNMEAALETAAYVLEHYLDYSQNDMAVQAEDARAALAKARGE